MHSQPFIKFVKTHIGVILAALVTICVAGLYVSVAATRLTNANFGGDGGDFLAAILTRGIPHPTGYPTYILLGILFQYLPFGTAVFRGALESAVPAALSAGLLTGWMGFILGTKSAVHYTAAGIAGIAWGVAPLLFSQAVIVEVHGLQSLIVVLVLWWISLNLRAEKRKYRKWALGLSFLVGIGCGNHLTIALMIPAVIFALIYSIHTTGSWRWMLAQIGLIMAGLLVYIYLPLRAQAYPAINWGNPQTWSGFLWEVSGKPYQGLLFNAESSVLWERIRSVSKILLDQFGALGLVAGAIGIIQFNFAIRWMRWILVWIFMAYFSFAIVYQSQDSIGYLLPAIMVFSIWIGLAIPSIWKLKWKQIPLGFFLAGILVISVGYRIPGTRARVDPRGEDQPARYAEQLLREAPLKAIVYTKTDQDSFPLWYYHFGLQERKDLHIIVLPLTQFVWYQQTLVHTYPDLRFPTLYAEDQPNVEWGEEIKTLNTELPICNTQLSSESVTGVEYQCSEP